MIMQMRTIVTIKTIIFVAIIRAQRQQNLRQFHHPKHQQKGKWYSFVTIYYDQIIQNLHIWCDDNGVSDMIILSFVQWKWCAATFDLQHNINSKTIVENHSWSFQWKRNRNNINTSRWWWGGGTYAHPQTRHQYALFSAIIVIVIVIIIIIASSSSFRWCSGHDHTGNSWKPW